MVHTLLCMKAYTNVDAIPNYVYAIQNSMDDHTKIAWSYTLQEAVSATLCRMFSTDKTIWHTLNRDGIHNQWNAVQFKHDCVHKQAGCTGE